MNLTNSSVPARSSVSAAVLAFALSFSVAGCGVIIGGTSDTVFLDSSPSESTVEIGPLGQELTTPTQVSLKRKNDYVVTFSRDGYESRQVAINHNIRGAILAGDILGGLIPVIVDAATGAWFELEPERVSVTLSRTSTAMEGPDEIPIRLSTHGDRLKVDSAEPVRITIREK